MLLVVCVDLDDDIGCKADVETPVIGRDAVRDAAVRLATADPEDSDVNVLFQGVHVAETIDDERVVVTAVAGNEAADVAANRKIGDEIDEILATLDTGEEVRALVVTDGAQDETVLPVIRSRIPVDGVQRVVVRQAQDLESMYYTIKQVLDDPETRGTLLVPLGILLLIYPLAIVASLAELPGLVLGVTSGLLGLYLLGRGLGIETLLDESVARLRSSLYAGRVTIITYLVAAVLLVVGGYNGVEQLAAKQAESPGAPTVVATLVHGAINWFAAAGVTTSVGQITDEYLSGALEWRYLNAPVYVLAIALVVRAVAAYVLGEVSLSYLAAALTGGTLLGLASTLAFAIAESRFPRRTDAA
jgi:putative membrane protein